MQAVPCIVFALTLLLVLSNFIMLYVINPQSNIMIAETDYFTKKIYYIDFFTFYVIFTISLYVIFLGRRFSTRLISFVTGLTSAIMMLYTNSNFFTLKIPVFALWIMALVLSFSKKLNIIFPAFCIIIFTILQYVSLEFYETESIFFLIFLRKIFTSTFIFNLMAVMLFSLLYRSICERLEISLKTERHVNMVMNQMSVINSELQQLAKTKGEEAAKNERLRITRDMHDTCGYVFVNICALIDAAASQREFDREKIDELFLTVRNLASNGLKETRKTLHAIRDVENPVESSFDAIYDIRNIFITVTGINVEIANGNIKKDYGRQIDSIIVRTMQEALTNSIRHGQAKNIYISFWEENNILTMIVKDDGIGSDTIVKGIGLAGMEERLSKVSGKLETSTPAEGGFKLTISIPLTEHDIETAKEDETDAAKN